MPPLNLYTLVLALLLCLGTSLCNTKLFGPLTLTAYFGYTIFAAITVFVAVSAQSFKKAKVVLPHHIIFFTVLAIYIIIHGIATNTVNLIHYYWAISALLLFALHCHYRLLSPASSQKFRRILFTGISYIVLVESTVVIGQFLKLVPSKDLFFACTGTCQNPNVTAVFLAMGLYAFLHTTSKYKVASLLLVPVLISIVLLKCRSAYIVSLLLITGHFWQSIEAITVQKFKSGKYALQIAVIIALILFVAISSFCFKQGSTNGRLRIWGCSLSLILERPITGHGFGLFEKCYNSYIASRPSPKNDHAFMAYNDFLELGVEGGLIAVALWTAFVASLLVYNIREKKTVWPIVAFLVVQFTNFGFQSVPTFALFILYTSSMDYPFLQTNEFQTQKFRNIGSTVPNFRAIGICIAITAIFFAYYQGSVSRAFYKGNEIIKNDLPKDALPYLAALGALSRSQWYHESFGDCYLEIKQYDSALVQYRLALLGSNEPRILSKFGWCYQQLSIYDSSGYYYTMAQNIQPYMFGTKMALLQLYQQSGDSNNMYRKAVEISMMPIKVENEEVHQIKAYANKLLARKPL